MRGVWPRLLGGLIVWAAHFLTLYAIGEWGDDTVAARIGVAIATGIALGLNLLLLRGVAARQVRDKFEGWYASIARAALAISTIAIVWQGLPALFGWAETASIRRPVLTAPTMPGQPFTMVPPLGCSTCPDM